MLIFDHQIKKNNRSNRKRTIKNFLCSCIDIYIYILMYHQYFLRYVSLEFTTIFFLCDAHILRKKSSAWNFIVANVNELRRYSSNQASPIPTSFVALGISNSILNSSKNRFILRNNVVRMKWKNSFKKYRSQFFI